MKIGILGAGKIGGTLAQLFAEAGHSVILSNSRGPETLREQVEQLGSSARAATAEEAADSGEIVIEAVPFGRVRELPAENARGKILISASNYFPERDGRIADVEEGGPLTHTEFVARHFDEARVVKAFNTIYWQHLGSQGDPSKPLEERRVVPIAGDDAEAKETIAQIIREIGFGPLDMGSLRDGGRQMQPGQPIYTKDVTLQEANRLVD